MTRPKTIGRRIVDQQRKMSDLDARIGRLMSQRVTEEEKLAALLYAERDCPSRLAKALDTIMRPGFGE